MRKADAWAIGVVSSCWTRAGSVAGLCLLTRCRRSNPAMWQLTGPHTDSWQHRHLIHHSHAGCVIFELCTGGTPLFNWSSDREKYMQLARVYDEGWAPPRLPPHAAGWQEVVDALLSVDPVERALPADVLQMGIFACDTPAPPWPECRHWTFLIDFRWWGLLVRWSLTGCLRRAGKCTGKGPSGKRRVVGA
jgi:serine/threonine protein kinase